MANVLNSALPSQSLQNGKKENIPSPQSHKILNETVAFVVKNSTVGISWQEVKDAFAKVIEEKCKTDTHSAIAAMADLLGWVFQLCDISLSQKFGKSWQISRCFK